MIFAGVECERGGVERGWNDAVGPGCIDVCDWQGHSHRRPCGVLHAWQVRERSLIELET